MKTQWKRSKHSLLRLRNLHLRTRDYFDASRHPMRREVHQWAIGDLGGLLAPSLVLGLDPPSSETGDTYLCFGPLAFLSPINATHLIPIPQCSHHSRVQRPFLFGDPIDRSFFGSMCLFSHPLPIPSQYVLLVGLSERVSVIPATAPRELHGLCLVALLAGRFANCWVLVSRCRGRIGLTGRVG